MAASRSISKELVREPNVPLAPVVLQKEVLLIEMLLSGLDLRANAAQARSPMLIYLVDLLVMRAREELSAIGDI